MKVVFNVTDLDHPEVVSVDVLCRQCEVPRYEKLDLTRNYRLIVPSFIGAGGNGFVAFTKRTNYRPGDMKDVEVVERYIKKMEPVIQRKDGRIVVITGA